MSEGVKEKFVHVLTIMMLIVIIVGGLVAIYPIYMREEKLKQKDAELQRCIESRQREIDKLRVNEARFKNDPEFVEMVARRNRRVFPGELIFIFNDK